MRTPLLAIVVALLPACAGSRRPAEPPPDQVQAPEPQGPRYYFCLHTRGAITIDGRIVEPAWERAQWTRLFVDIEGADKPAPRYGTAVKMMWDQQYLYVGGLMDEPHLRGSLTGRDAVIYRDNDFEVFIDPDGNARDYYEIEVNALNTVFDLYLPKTYGDGGDADHGWDCPGLVTAVDCRGTLNDPSDRDAGWAVEMAIPWAAIAPHANVPAPPRPGDVWRINYSRVEWPFTVVNGVYENVPDAPEDNWVWSPQGVIDMHRPRMWGYVEFVRQW